MDLILLQPGNADDIIGESSSTHIDAEWRDDNLQFGKCLELVSIHHGMKQQITTDVSNRARTSGRPVITEFTCVKYVDQTSVKFYDYCLRAAPLGIGKDNPTKIYIARNSGDKTANIITMELRDAIISEIQFQSHPDDMPTEQFKINFTEILWTFTTQDVDVSRPGSIRSGWSIMHNRPIGNFT
ncbi:type VI secretion system tube protein Hcp [Pseudothauera nasutitermitis]|uniref:Type VI secretion system tube protein Hcp n=1 Tax=Pseudothauera nasutitermitis TaxID=2565930 RepID=A0A4S4AUR1_9RHOO|nr:type VI secretion system tube protein Hcp [Pseudothauera nasutitermitis]THF63711.1 type VI secretion system tube protein Hcp [Pseudothauera nasutitermitis]